MKTTKAKKRQRIYLDYASATPVDPRVALAMRKVEKDAVGNPSALHSEGRKARQIVEDARKTIAGLINARADEIIWTSGATESNNLAILGLYNALISKYQKLGKTPHIISSSIEHKSILEVLKFLEDKGVDVTYLDPNPEGIISTKDLRKAMTKDTMLVSIMHANNEIGTINDIKEISKEVRHARRKLDMSVSGTPYFHTDAVQSVNYLKLDMGKIEIDLMTLQSPKIYGPAGVGLLQKRRSVPLSPIIFGGGQENGLRSGRELPVLAYGFAEAFKITVKEMDKEVKRIIKLRDYFLKLILKEIPEARLNGSLENRLPNNINICIPGIDSEFAVICLDENGVSASSASTCMNTSEESYSYVLERLYKDKSCATSSIRFTLGRFTEKKDVEESVKVLKKILKLQKSY